MKTTILTLVVTALISSSAFANSKVISVGECKPYELKRSTDWSNLGQTVGAYYNYAFQFTTCEYSTLVNIHEKKSYNQVIDLGTFEDNDVSGITETLKMRCEVEQKNMESSISLAHPCD